MYYSHKNEINLDQITNKIHFNDSNAVNDETPPSLTLKHGRRDNYHEEAIPFLGEYDPSAPYPIVSSLMHHNGSNSSGIGSFSGPGNQHYSGRNIRNLCQRDGRIVSTDIEDLSTDDDNTCPASNKGPMDEMFDSISSNPASSIMHQELSHPSTLLSSIPPPPSEPPPSTPRDSYLESTYPKGTMVVPGSHAGLQNMRNMLDHDHILQQIPGVMEVEPIPMSYLMTQTNSRIPTMYSSPNGPTPMPSMGTIGRYRNQSQMPDSAAMATLPHTHSQNGFGAGTVPRGPGSVGGTSNVYENPYNSLNRQNGKHIKIGSSGPFPASNSNHEMGYPVMTQAVFPANQILYRQGSVRSPPHQSFTDSFFGIGKEGGGRCSWNCIRISLFSLAILLLLSLIAYFAAKSVWLEGRLNKRFAQDPVVIGLFDPNNLPETIVPMKPIPISFKPMGVWSGRWLQNRSDFVHFNFTITAATNLGVFLRINSVPTIVRYSFFDRVSGNRWKQRILDQNRNRVKRSADENYQEESTGIVNYLEKGLWFVSVVNDQPREENIHFVLNTKVVMKQSCPDSCNKHGLCTENGLCECFTGFKGKDCSIVDAPAVCTGHGSYFQGRCLCNPEWKGVECQTIWYECQQSSCSGNGDCVSGDCVCKPGYGGSNCSDVLCPKDCSQHGMCLRTGQCKCFQGWTGKDCATKFQNAFKTRANNCANKGVSNYDGSCTCSKEFEGHLCQLRRCFPACSNGQCSANGKCKCNEGFRGATCAEAVCDKRCYLHGRCIAGVCYCNKGWMGKHCTIDGCPHKCNDRGQCSLNQDNVFQCACLPTWKGASCNISKEKDCDDGVDNDNDGLIDCQDPDCCPTEHCEMLTNQKQKLAEESCPLMDNLQLLLLTTKLARPGSAFHEQIEFLTKRKYTSSTLSDNKIAVVRGRIVQEDGSPFQGCRIQDRLDPVNGHTFTDRQGIFDLVVEGGRLVQLEIIRHPAARFTGYHNVYVPINAFVNIGEFVLKDLRVAVIEDPSNHQGCMIQDHSVHDGSIVDGPRLLVDWSSEIVPIYETDTLSMAIDNGVLVSSIDLKETKLKLMHRSSRVKGFKSALMIVLLGEKVPERLKEIKLQIDVAGQIINKRLEPDPYLTYIFYWDRLNAYNRKMYGLEYVKVKAGYEYWNCSTVFWQTRLTPINGHDLAAKDIGNWNLNIRHIFDYNHGIVYRGDGSHIFFTETNWRIKTIAGIEKTQRDFNNCAGCDGNPLEKRFFSLNSIVSDDKGRIIIADGKYIRILSKASPTSTKWFLMAPYNLKFIQEPETSFKTLAIFLSKHENHPTATNDITSGDQRFYASISHSGSIWIIDPGKETHRLLIGDKCDEKTCIKEKLIYPKGMAMSYNFSLYFADGRAIKMFSGKDMSLTTIVGDASALSEHARLPGCYEGFPASRTRLRWPTHVVYNPIDDCIYFVDNMDMIYRIGLDNMMVTIFAGNTLDCPSSPSETIPANRYRFDEIRDIAISPSGELYIAEKRNVWVVKSDGYLYAVTGTKPNNQFQTRGLFNSITSITVTMFGELIVADNNLFQLFSVHYSLPVLVNGQYQVLSSDTRQVHSFNTDGQHVRTNSSITGTQLYSLHFRLHSINGWLSKILSPSGSFQFRVHRDTQSRATQLETPSGTKYNVTLDETKRINSLTIPGCTWRFEYNDQDLLTSVQECQKVVPYRFSYYPNSGRLHTVVRPSGVTTTFEEHPMFADYTRKRFAENRLVKGLDMYRLVTAALTPHSSLFYSSLTRTTLSNNATNILFMQLRLTGPSTQIKFTNGFQPKEISLIDSQFKVQYPTHSILYYHSKTQTGMKFIRKIHIKSSKPSKPYKSEWSYRLSQSNQASTRYKRSISPNYMVSNNDYEWNDAAATVLSYGHPRILKVNGRKRLYIQYEAMMKEEYYSTYKGDVLIPLLKVQYNDDFQVTKITFTNTETSLTDVIVSYLNNGKITAILWPKPILNIDYDRFNRTSVVYNAFLNEVLRFKYEDDSANTKVTEIRRGKSASYRLLYDEHEKLMSVTTPNNIRVEVTQLISLGYRRILYQPYGVSFNFVYDFETLHDNLFRLIYPSREYQINFFRSSEGELSDVIYGSERITWNRSQSSSLVTNIDKWDHSRGFTLYQSVGYDGPLLIQINSTLIIPSPSNDIVVYNSELIYNYDSDMQVSKTQLVLHDPSRTQTDLRLESTLINNILNRRIQWDEFKFIFEQNEKILLPSKDSYIFSKYNTNGQLQNRIIVINGKQVSLAVSYNGNNKNPFLISSFKIKRSNSNDEFDTKLSYYLESEMVTTVHNIDYIEYKYYEDGRLKSMRINTGAPIEYIYDDKTGLVRKCGLVSYLYNDDGFLTQKLTGLHHEKFSYNAFGLMKEYTKESGKKVFVKVEYFYDSRHRLILQRDLINPKSMYQYFYSDPSFPSRLTHMFDSKMRQLSTYYYDSAKGHLFSIRVDKTFFYVLSDFVGSPRIIVSQSGEVVWERDYDIFGEFKSIKDWSVHIPIGYAGSIADPQSRMLFINNRIYDPNGKSFAGFHWPSLFTQLSNIKVNPLAINTYQFHYFPHTFETNFKVDFSNFLKPDVWMKKMGIDVDSLVSETPLMLSRNVVSLPEEFSMKYVFNQFSTDSVINSMAKHSAKSFQELRSLETSDLVTQDLLPYYLTEVPQIPTNLFSFHPNISISISDGGILHMTTNVDNLDSPFKLIASALFRNTTLINVYSSRKDLVLIFLLKQSCNMLRFDLRELGMFDKTQQAFGHNLNLSVVNHDKKMTEIILHQRYFLISVRYCSTVKDQTALISQQIRSDTEKTFWANKRRQLYRHELIQDQLIGHSKDELLKFGMLRETMFDNWYNVSEFPLLFDDLSVYKVRRVVAP